MNGLSLLPIIKEVIIYGEDRCKFRKLKAAKLAFHLNSDRLVFNYFSDIFSSLLMVMHSVIFHAVYFS